MPEIKGVSWQHTGRGGNEYMSGNIEVNGLKIDILLFKNTDKMSERSPDWTIKAKEPKKTAPPSEDDFTEKRVPDDLPF